MADDIIDIEDYEVKDTQIVETSDEDDYKGQKVVNNQPDGGDSPGDLLGEIRPCLIHAVHLAEVVDAPGLEHDLGVLQRKADGRIVQLDLIHVLALELVQEFVVPGLLHAALRHVPVHEAVEQDDQHDRQDIINDDLPRGFFEVEFIAPVVVLAVGIVLKIEDVSEIRHNASFRFVSSLFK